MLLLPSGDKKGWALQNFSQGAERRNNLHTEHWLVLASNEGTSDIKAEATVIAEDCLSVLWQEQILLDWEGGSQSEGILNSLCPIMERQHNIRMLQTFAQTTFHLCGPAVLSQLTWACGIKAHSLHFSFLQHLSIRMRSAAENTLRRHIHI